MDYKLLLQIDMDVDVFASNWSHCDRLSSYMARMVSHNRTDSLLYTNLFSSAVNELLETVFRSSEGDGKFACSVSRSDTSDRIELTIPCGIEGTAFFRDTMSKLSRPDVGAVYRSALLAEGPLDPGIGLLELAVDYNARIVVEEPDGKNVRLIAELALENAGS